MSLFKGVVTQLARSRGPLEFSNIGNAIGKSKMSVKSEIGRLKKTSWISRWLKVDWKTETVRLTTSLRRQLEPDALEFLIKQFYNEDKRTKKGLFDPNKKIDLNTAEDFKKKIEYDFSDIDLKITGVPEPKKEEPKDETPVMTLDDIDFSKIGCGYSKSQ